MKTAREFKLYLINRKKGNPKLPRNANNRKKQLKSCEGNHPKEKKYNLRFKEAEDLLPDFEISNEIQKLNGCRYPA